MIIYFMKKILIVACLLIISSSNVFAGPMDDMLLNGATNNNMEMINTALNNGANINFKRGFQTPLSWAVKNNNIEITQYLLSKGAFVDVGNLGSGWNNETNLMIAVDKNNLAMVQLLAEAGENVNASKYAGRTALIMAVERNNMTTDIINYLISKKANVNKSTVDGYTPLMAVANSSSYNNNSVRLEVAEILLKVGANPSLRSRDGKTALQYAIDKNNMEMINLLLPVSPKR